jgi:hypothetical protein
MIEIILTRGPQPRMRDGAGQQRRRSRSDAVVYDIRRQSSQNVNKQICIELTVVVVVVVVVVVMSVTSSGVGRDTASGSGDVGHGRGVPACGRRNAFHRHADGGSR